MKHRRRIIRLTSARAGRLFVLAAAALVLCSCKGTAPCPATSAMPGAPSPALPPEAFTGAPPGAPGFVPPGGPIGPPGMEAGVPLPAVVTGPWQPPGIAGAWPQDEYLADGGDDGYQAVVGPEWEVRGLEPEDTIAHFDTLDGRRLVEPSNRVHIYSPRFGAVRQVVSLRQNEEMTYSAGIHAPTKLVQHEETQVAYSRQQQVVAEGQLGRNVVNVCRTRQGDGALSTAVGPRSFQDAFLPFEDLAIIRQGIFETAEMAFLAQGVDAAIAWSHVQAVQVILDRERATEAISDQSAETIFVVNDQPAKPRLRLIKVASKQLANPGETVDFTLRFDNVGNQPIGNVTIIDNLSSRLEYVPDTAQCSVTATFVPQPSSSGSLVLRWEITDPLRPGEGGIARFRCRVR